MNHYTHNKFRVCEPRTRSNCNAAVLYRRHIMVVLCNFACCSGRSGACLYASARAVSTSTLARAASIVTRMVVNATSNVHHFIHWVTEVQRHGSRCFGALRSRCAVVFTGRVSPGASCRCGQAGTIHHCARLNEF